MCTSSFKLISQCMLKKVWKTGTDGRTDIATAQYDRFSNGFIKRETHTTIKPYSFRITNLGFRESNPIYSNIYLNNYFPVPLFGKSYTQLIYSKGVFQALHLAVLWCYVPRLDLLRLAVCWYTVWKPLKKSLNNSWFRYSETLFSVSLLWRDISRDISKPCNSSTFFLFKWFFLLQHAPVHPFAIK